MRKYGKTMTGAAAAALIALTAAAPAQAQYDPYYDHDRGLDVSDIVTGVAIAGAAAAAIGAISNAARGYDGRYYDRSYGNGYDPRYGNGYDRRYGNQYDPRYGNAGYNNYGMVDQRYAVDVCAQRASRYGRISVTQVRPRNSRTLRVEGIADASYNRGYGFGYGNADRRAFQCDVRSDGRISYFDTDRIRY